MIDVHPPDHHISGFRDFVTHMLIITAGLLIALALENAAEALHHRHLRHEAEAQIRGEIQANLDEIQKEAPTAIDERDKMLRVLRAIEARANNQPGPLQLKESDFGFREAPMQDAAWSTANSTGALAYMDYAEVERFSEAYKEQALLQTMEEKALDDYLQLVPILSHHGDDLTPENAKEALPYIRRVLSHIGGMLAVGQGTIGSYQAALKQ